MRCLLLCILDFQQKEDEEQAAADNTEKAAMAKVLSEETRVKDQARQAQFLDWLEQSSSFDEKVQAIMNKAYAARKEISENAEAESHPP